MKRLVFAILITAGLSSIAGAKYSGGSGTADDPYQIANAADLLALAADTNDYDKNIVLTADIDLSSSGTFTTAVIAQNTYGDLFHGTSFTGTFDGAGHKISNLTINTNGAGNSYLGLFGYLQGGEIKNLGLKNVTIDGNDSGCLGGLVGGNYNGSISNCYSIGTVTVGNNSDNIGGLVGYSYYGDISNCYSTCTVTGGDNSEYLGGLVGNTAFGCTISNCYSIGTITGGNGSDYLGGLVGDNDGDVNNCYSVGVVNGGHSSLFLGGLAGYNHGGTISNCYSTVIVTSGSGSQELGGLAGRNEDSIRNCYSTGNVTSEDGSKYLGGLAGFNCGDVNNCYSTGSVTGKGSSRSFGGLVGTNLDGNIRNCHSSGAVVGGDEADYFGGLIGENSEDTDVNNCYSISTVNGGDWAQKVGGLVGDNWGNISNCHSTGNVNCGDNSEWVGGLVGDSGGGNITNCYSTGAVSSGGGYSSGCLGGLIGSASDTTISNCYSKGAVTGGNNSGDLGGLVGLSNSPISKCYSSGTVIGGSSSSALGGLTGLNQGSISNCYSTGNLTGGSNSSYVGGLVGLNDGTISNCYSTGTVATSGIFASFRGGLVGYYIGGTTTKCYFLTTSGPDNGFGTPLTDTQMKKQASFIGWDFIGETANGTEDIWKINEGVGYPKLAWQTDANGDVTLTINTVGNGSVTKNPDQATYSDGDMVELTAAPDVGWSFDSWSGDMSGSANPETITLDGNKTVTATFTMNGPEEMSITKCKVTAGKTEGYDTIVVSGKMDATADDLSDANNIEVTVDSNDMVNPCVQSFSIDETTLKNGKYRYSGTEDGVKESFKYDVKTGKFSFTAKNVDLSGLGCPVSVGIEIGDYNATAEVNEAIVNGTKKPIPIKLMMGVKNSLRVDKIRVKKPNSDQLLVKGGFAVADTNVNLAAVDFVVGLAGQTWTIPAGRFTAKKGVFTCKNIKLSGGEIANAGLNLNTCVFTMTIKNTKITAGSGAANFSVEFADFDESVQIVLP
jgi:hypothetical protein